MTKALKGAKSENNIFIAKRAEVSRKMCEAKKKKKKMEKNIGEIIF